VLGFGLASMSDLGYYDPAGSLPRPNAWSCRRRSQSASPRSTGPSLLCSPCIEFVIQVLSMVTHVPGGYSRCPGPGGSEDLHLLPADCSIAGRANG
jgi:hypothetical protein